MKRAYGLILLFIFGCSGFETRKKELCHKWYLESDYYIRFNEDNTFDMEDLSASDGTQKYTGKYKLKKKNIISFTYPDGKIYQMKFDIKDSILLLINEDLAKQDGRELTWLDSVFYHKNPLYSWYQTQQLYLYGEIRDPDPLWPQIRFFGTDTLD